MCHMVNTKVFYTLLLIAYETLSKTNTLSRQALKFYSLFIKFHMRFRNKTTRIQNESEVAIAGFHCRDFNIYNASQTSFTLLQRV